MIKTKVKVYVAHIDAFGHVNNARYQEYLAIGRWEFFEHVPEASPQLKLGNGMAVLEEKTTYLRAAKLGDMLTIQTRVTIAEEKIFFITQELVDAKGREILRCEAKCVLFSTREGKAIALPEVFREQMLAISHLPEENDSPTVDIPIAPVTAAVA